LPTINPAGAPSRPLCSADFQPATLPILHFSPRVPHTPPSRVGVFSILPRLTRPHHTDQLSSRLEHASCVTEGSRQHRPPTPQHCDPLATSAPCLPTPIPKGPSAPDLHSEFSKDPSLRLTPLPLRLPPLRRPIRKRPQSRAMLPTQRQKLPRIQLLRFVSEECFQPPLQIRTSPRPQSIPSRGHPIKSQCIPHQGILRQLSPGCPTRRLGVWGFLFAFRISRRPARARLQPCRNIAPQNWGLPLRSTRLLP
jgi:hypothetical protein